MPTVTGTLKTYGLDVLPATMRPELVFVGSRMAINAQGDVLLPEPKPVTLRPDGSWTVTLAATEGLPHDAYYRLEARWLNGRRMETVLHERIRVPISGGPISDITANDSIGDAFLWVQETEPEGKTGYWLAAGDPAKMPGGVRPGDLFKLTL